LRHGSLRKYYYFYQNLDLPVIQPARPLFIGRKNSRQPPDPDGEVARLASIQLTDGDVHGAVEMLGSDDSYVVPSSSARDDLLPKHPMAPLDHRQVPASITPPLQCALGQVLSAVHWFKPQSCAGPYGLRPQHIQDMLQASCLMLSTALLDLQTWFSQEVSPGNMDFSGTTYSGLLHTYSFAPVTVETHGVWGAEAE